MTIGRSNGFNKSDWLTPQKYIDTITEFYGQIDLDPCSNEHSIVNANLHYILPDDGLKLPWTGRIFVNPPYGRQPNGTKIIDWLAKCSEISDPNQVIALVPVAPNTRHWKNHVFPTAQCICFLSDPRVPFHYPGIKSKGASMACALIYWGSETNKFNTMFAKHGFIWNLWKDNENGSV